MVLDRIKRKKTPEIFKRFVCDGETKTECLRFWYLYILFSAIIKIPPNIPPFCQSQNFSGAFCGISAKLWNMVGL